jgi:hypothetical protein
MELHDITAFLTVVTLYFLISNLNRIDVNI